MNKISMPLIDASYLRNRAEVLRACADYIKDQECHDVAMMCARSYELLAIHLDLAEQALGENDAKAINARKLSASLLYRSVK
jgi:hypothetical protein